MIVAGIDSGSRTLKGVLLELARQRVLASVCTDQMADQVGLADRFLAVVLNQAGARESDLTRFVGCPVVIRPKPQLCTARGAALIACESLPRESKSD